MRLIDHFMPLVAFVSRFRAGEECSDYRTVREEVTRLLDQAGEECREAGVPQQDFEEARFAVCSFVDETVLASKWRDRSLWQHEQLQRIFYGTTEAGVEFFLRLEALGNERREVREVYALCLSLGFRGRYIEEGDGFVLERLREANLKLVLDLPAIPSLEHLELFPGASASSPPAEGEVRLPPVLTPLSALLVAAPLILFGVLFLVYRYVLNGLALPLP